MFEGDGDAVSGVVNGVGFAGPPSSWGREVARINEIASRSPARGSKDYLTLLIQPGLETE